MRKRKSDVHSHGSVPSNADERSISCVWRALARDSRVNSDLRRGSVHNGGNELTPRSISQDRQLFSLRLFIIVRAFKEFDKGREMRYTEGFRVSGFQDFV